MTTDVSGNSLPHPESLPDSEQAMLEQIVDFAYQVVHLPDTHGFGNESTVSHSTPHDAMRDNILGIITFSDRPKYDPVSFLEMRLLENGYGETRSETEKVYSFSRELSDVLEPALVLKTSDAISLLETTELMHEQAVFASSLPPESDPEMLEDLGGAMAAELSDAFTLDEQEIALTLKKATPEETAQLYGMLKNLVEGRLYVDKEADEEEAYFQEEQNEWYRTYGDEVTTAARAARFGRLGEILLARLMPKRK